jgi:predicted nuclease of predicted toxin-antitoxin system
MTERVLLDQGVPRSAVGYLAANGIAAEHVGDLDLAAATDETILEAARQRGAILVTLDADFHALLAASGASGPSVVRIRVEGLKGNDVAAAIRAVLTAVGPELKAGAVASVAATRVRVRRLPL